MHQSLTRLRHFGAFILIAGSLAACGAQPPVAEAPHKRERLLLAGVTIVDVDTGALRPNQSILLNNGRIASITSSDAVRPAGARVIDARGKYVVPGFLDMHAHVLGDGDPRAALALMLAHGVTGFRQMSGSSELLEQRRSGSLERWRDGPALLAMPGTILTPLNAGSPKAAVDEIRAQKAAGADFIKSVVVSAPTFLAARTEANRLGIPFVGHLQEQLAPLVAQRGVKSIEHMGGGEGYLLSCSDQEQVLRREVAAKPAGSGPPFKIPYLEQILAPRLRKALINPILQAEVADEARLMRAVESFDVEKCAQFARVLAPLSWQVPTLVRLRTMYLGNAPEYRRSPDLTLVPKQTVEAWQEVGDEFAARPQAVKNNLAKAYGLQLQIVRLLYEAGAHMMTGDDFGGGWIAPGAGLHHEFDELERAGIPPLAVLQMATRNGAQFLGRSDTMGSVATGKVADLVLLDANPVEGVSNLHAVSGVIRAGYYYDREGIAALKSRAKHLMSR